EEEPALASRLQVALAPRVTAGPGRGVGRDDAFALAIGAAAGAARGGSAARRPLLAVRRRWPQEKRIPERGVEGLARLKPAAALRLRIHEDRDGGGADGVIPTRVSFVQETGSVRAAAITDTATVAERTVVFDLKLVQELVERMTDPEASVVPDLSRLLRRL